MNKKPGSVMLAVTNEEIESLEKVIEYSMTQEAKDCKKIVFENSEGKYDVGMTGGELDKQFEHLSEGHIYWELLKIQGLLDRIKSK